MAACDRQEREKDHALLPLAVGKREEQSLVERLSAEALQAVSEPQLAREIRVQKLELQRELEDPRRDDGAP